MASTVRPDDPEAVFRDGMVVWAAFVAIERH
jgi:hypothetical protein